MAAADIRNTEQLARDVYVKCRDCEGEYKTFANDVRGLQNDLQDVETSAAANPSSAYALTFEIVDLVTACDALLQELSDLVEKFNNLPIQSQRTWDRLNWGDNDNDSGIRARLTELSTQLNTLYKRLKQSPTAQIDRALQVLAREVSNGRHETSTATSLSTTAVDPDDDFGWERIKRDLGDLGIEERMVDNHKEHITDWILRAINDGILTDEKIPVAPQGIQMLQLSPPPRPPKTPVISTPEFQPSPAPPPDYAPKMLVTAPPQRQPSVSPPGLRPVVSQLALQPVSATGSNVDMDEPPSPISEPRESNILWNAQRICYHWNSRQWKEAREVLEEQIRCVQRGEIVDVSGFPQQPDQRILQYLVAICHSFGGDFVRAREAFEAVLSETNIDHMDDGDIAAARWLGETCIMTNQILNASLAWALAYYGTITKYLPQVNKTYQHILDDLRALNRVTGGLRTLRNAFETSNRDASTILSALPGTSKFQIINAAIAGMDMYPNVYHDSRSLVQNISIAEGFLIQPLVAQKVWPFPQDPFFRTRPAIDLLHALSRPRMPLATTAIPTTSFSKAKSLTYVTKNSIDWLVEAIRYALNTYAIEWKIRCGEYLLRLSQTHDKIAYYDIFVIKFRKLPFRNMYGFKIADSTLATRSFNTKWHTEDNKYHDENARKEKIREELAERFQEYIKQAEEDKAKGLWPPEEMTEPAARAPYEVDSTSVLPNEMIDARTTRWELPGQGVVRRKQVAQPQQSYEIAELPG